MSAILCTASASGREISSRHRILVTWIPGTVFVRSYKPLPTTPKPKRPIFIVWFLLSVFPTKTSVFLWKTLAFYTETVYHIENQIAMLSKKPEIREN
jgi:hypothetical protein